MNDLTTEDIQQFVQQHEQAYQQIIDLYTTGKWKETKHKKDPHLYSISNSDSSFDMHR
jgi:hypothetical protein